MKVIPALKALPFWLFDLALMGVPPLLADELLPWGSLANLGTAVAFWATYAGFLIVWLLTLAISGYSRWRVWGTWRPGLRPCLCDKPTYCLRHRSSAREPNRPGVVAARLVEREDT